MKIVTINPYQPPSQFRLDFLAESIMEGLQKNDLEIISSDPCSHSGKIVDDNKLVEHAKDADYIFVIWDKKRLDKPEPKYYLLDKINLPNKTIFIDGAEWTYTGHLNPKPGQFDESLVNPSRRRGEPWIWEEMNEKVKWHFKRECYPQDREEYGCIPLPFASIDRYISRYTMSFLNRKYSIQCSFGNEISGLRKQVQEICKEFQSNNIIDDIIIEKMDYQRYIDTMNNSRCVVDGWGGGDCNARFYEAAINGALLIYQKYQILTPYPYIDGETAITYTTPEEFKEKVLYYFSDNIDKIIDMQKKSYQHTVNYHTSKQRVKYIFDVIQEKIDVDKIIK